MGGSSCIVGLARILRDDACLLAGLPDKVHAVLHLLTTVPLASPKTPAGPHADGTWFPEKPDAFQAVLRAAKGIRDIAQAGTPVLREPAKPIKPEEIETPQIQARISLLRIRVALFAPFRSGICAYRVSRRSRVSFEDSTLHHP